MGDGWIDGYGRIRLSTSDTDPKFKLLNDHMILYVAIVTIQVTSFSILAVVDCSRYIFSSSPGPSVLFDIRIRGL